MAFTSPHNRLIGAVAAGALIAGAGGVMLGRTLGPEATPLSEQEDTAHGPTGFVVMTPERLAAAGIRTERAAAGTLAAEILAQASIVADPQGEAVLTAPADGTITRIAKRLGDPVVAGESVAALESRDAAAIAAERSSASARARAARQTYTRERRLFDARITAREDLEAAQAVLAEADAELRRTQASAAAARVSDDGRHIAISSLIAGRITKADAKLGAYVSAGTELFRVADPRRIQIEAAVTAADARRIRSGDSAVIELPGGETVAARVRSATPSLDVESRAATILLLPIAPATPLTPGQSVRVRITPREASPTAGVVVPEAAVQSIAGRDSLFIRTRGGFQARPVTIGARGAGRVEIVGGLDAGTEIATTGAFLLKAELGKDEAEH